MEAAISTFDAAPQVTEATGTLGGENLFINIEASVPTVVSSDKERGLRQCFCAGRSDEDALQ